MSRVCLMLARLTLSAWVGAATLFVMNGVREVTSTDFDSLTRDRLVALRFPGYYQFGFVLLGVALLCLLAALSGRVLPRVRHAAVILLAGASLAVMVLDYTNVYRPLEAMITPAGQARPMEFTALHEQSKRINSVHVGLCLCAAILVCWPAPGGRQAGSETNDG
ncbi:MAG: hypothetical protein DWQ34_20665 [Planctomycetota bacterium]|nr:MAG: hypothetical protein DWQ29_09785 [Planctomycetota bacterium]REJ89081.1 MAG: hypothetical protein DWQ34_20665 [Planctomycetota bacterium]REK25219.1 MAG: hypothetical protein DWQ41_12470 [Planctomycetota bacterium]REK32119.1 MAG: hypothetical protein DWQ45_17910 [Planctomycetota bacterium]